MAEKKIKHLVRINKTDIMGERPLNIGLTKIKGIGKSFANAICFVSEIPKSEKVGYLTDEQLKKLENIIANPLKFNIPQWLLNRRNDYETGANLHLIKSDLDFTKDNDLKRLKKIKSYRGFRHHLGLPCRGQRTKSNFRKNKAKASLGVKRKK